MSPPYPPPVGPPVIGGPAPRRWPTVVFWLSIALIVVGVVGLLGDWATRTIEMTRLAGAIERSEAAMSVAQQGIGAVAVPEDATSTDKQSAIRELEAVSARSRDDVADAGSEVSGLTFLPWHTEVLRAQASYLDHNEAWVDYLDRGSTEPLTLFQDDNRIEPTWIAAERWVRAAVPFPPYPPLAQRIDRIFEEGDSESGDGLTA